MGMIIRSQRTYWYIRSVSDPRWNVSGEAPGMFSACWAIDEAVKAKQAELGIEPPADLEYGGTKD